MGVVRWSCRCGICAVIGIAANLFGQLGDLSMSLIKREAGIKDYSHIFLTHGGVLDRFDSILFLAPVVYAAVMWMERPCCDKGHLHFRFHRLHRQTGARRGGQTELRVAALSANRDCGPARGPVPQIPARIGRLMEESAAKALKSPSWRIQL